MSRLCWPALLVLLASFGCGRQRAIPSPPRFDRPNRVDFVCVDNGVPVWMVRCIPCPDRLEAPNGNGRIDNRQVCNPHLRDADKNYGVALHALVTQSARGEVAAVNLATQTVLDSRRDVPGFTFVTTGVQPIAVAAPRVRPELTYVADFGSHDVRVIQTQALVAPSTGSAEAQVVPLTVDLGSGPLPAAPTDMLLAPDEDALFVTLPDFGRVLRLPITRCLESGSDCHDGWIDESGITSVSLDASMDKAVVPEPSAHPRYEELCGYSLPEPPLAKKITLAPDAFVTAPRPSSLAVDGYCTGQEGCRRRLLIGDEALPVIHVIDIDAFGSDGTASDALLPPLVTGVPTQAVTVTPPVPTELDATDDTQYVYAIDATDGSVLVLENGEVLNVTEDPNARPDRLALGSTGPAQPWAKALAVLTPEYDPLLSSSRQWIAPAPSVPPTNTADSLKVCTDAPGDLENPARLRGVFLSVAMSDGTLAIVDIHDLELRPDRANHQACRACIKGIPIPLAERHHLRIGVNFVPQPGADQVPLTPTATSLSFQEQSLTYDIRGDGTSGTLDAPGLACIRCDSDQVSVFPPPGTDVTTVCKDKDKQAFLCAPDDPWVARELWRGTYEGFIPGTLGAGAHFSAPGSSDNLSGAPELVGAAGFCGAGVLGDDDIGPAFADAECDAPDPAEPVGDQLVVRTPLLGKNGLEHPNANQKALTELEARCASATQALIDDPSLVIGLPIRRAYGDRLVLSHGLTHAVGKLHTFEDLEACLRKPTDPEVPLSYEVRTRRSFAMVGDQSGFMHRVREGEDGRCVVDSAADPILRGRVRMGCTFRNRSLAFRLAPPETGEPEPTPGVRLLVRTATPAGPLILNTNNVGFGSAIVVPTALRYSEADQRLYMVDVQDRGLVPMTLNPFPVLVNASGTFN
jgi:hypothetical protein